MEIRGIGYRYILKKKSFSLVTIGIILSILAASFEAIGDVLPKPLIEASEANPLGLNPILLTFIIFSINGLFFSGFTRKTKSVSKIGHKKISLLILVGIIDVSSVILYYFGLKETSAINASILGNSEIIFGLLIAMMIFRERLKGSEILPFSIIILGSIMMPMYDSFANNGMEFSEVTRGDILVIFGSLLLAVDVILYRYVSDKIDSKRIIQITSFAGAGFSLLLIILLQIPLYVDFTQLPMIFFVGIFGFGISTLFFVIALRFLGASRTLLIFSSTTVYSVLFSSIFLFEEISPGNVISMGLVIFGTYMLRNKLSENF